MSHTLIKLAECDYLGSRTLGNYHKVTGINHDAISIYRSCHTIIGISIMKIKWSHDHLIFIIYFVNWTLRIITSMKFNQESLIILQSWKLNCYNIPKCKSAFKERSAHMVTFSYFLIIFYVPSYLGPSYKHAQFKFDPSTGNNYIHHKVWDEITSPFPNFNGCSMEVWEWISNFIPHFDGHVIIYAGRLNHVNKRGPCYWNVQLYVKIVYHTQRSFCECAQPIRDDVTQ